MVTHISLSQPQFGTTDAIESEKEGGRNLEASVTGEAVLGALVISETSQLPKPPVMAGITVKEKTDEGVGCHCCVVDSGVSEPSSG